MPLFPAILRFISRHRDTLEDRAHQRAYGDCFPAPILNFSFHSPLNSAEAPQDHA
jgi:hypothetical protein